MTTDTTVYLRHILDCIGRIEDYTREGREAFLRGAKTQDAVMRNLEVIGQVVKDIGTPTLGAAGASVLWGGAFAALRNVPDHQYLGVDIKRVWNIVERDVPPPKAALVELISRMPAS